MTNLHTMMTSFISNTRHHSSTVACVAIYVILLHVLGLASAAGSDVRQKQPQGRVSVKEELYCPPCQEVTCPVKRPQTLKCRGGVTLGICNCCTVCAKVEEEPCGGPWDYQGKCDTGLYCDVSHLTDDKSNTPGGICRKKAVAAEHQWRESNIYLQPVKDQPSNPASSTCKPRCTPQFCAKRPKAMCSAAYLDTAMEVGSRTCRGECQHTSCQACRIVDVTGLACGKCSQNDFTCIRQWGACMRKNVCRRDHAPCTYGPPSGYGEGNMLVGTFKCIVPQCP